MAETRGLLKGRDRSPSPPPRPPPGSVLAEPRPAHVPLDRRLDPVVRGAVAKLAVRERDPLLEIPVEQVRGGQLRRPRLAFWLVEQQVGLAEAPAAGAVLERIGRQRL